MTSSSADPVMQALAYPFDRELATFPEQGDILLANPVAGSGPWTSTRTTVWQWWRGPASGFEKGGYPIVTGDLPADQKFAIVLVRLPRQREEAQYIMASAWNALEAGGLFMVAAANDSGGSRLEKDLAPYLTGFESASKHKCRIVWCRKDKQTLPASWLKAGAMQKLPDLDVWSQPGLFSWDRIDPATTMLLPFISTGLKGRIADLGCGTGVIAHFVLKNNPDVTAMICADADARAIEASKRNLSERHPTRAVDYHWIDLSQQQSLGVADAVIMNPPFHAEKLQAIALGQAFIKNAAALLKPGGSLWLVANAHLPYEAVLQATFKKVEKCHEGSGFKVIRAIR